MLLLFVSAAKPSPSEMRESYASLETIFIISILIESHSKSNH